MLRGMSTLLTSLLLIACGTRGGPDDTDPPPRADTAPPSDRDGDGWSSAMGDCDDADGGIFPGAEELPDGVDGDCDGLVDEGTAAYDDDGDGFSEDGTGGGPGDCDDADGGIFPGAEEQLDDVDQDCDGLVDEGTEAFDDDGDGYTELGGDCDDGDPAISPGVLESVDGTDEDCDALIDEGTEAYDDDGDGYTELDGDCDDGSPDSGPEADEVIDGADNDCDGLSDEPQILDFDEDALLIMPDEDGLQFIASDTSTWRSLSWEDLVPVCDGACYGEGGSTDGDGLLATYVMDTQLFNGGVIELDIDGNLLGGIQGLSFPHDAVRHPADGSIIVAEAFGFITWYDSGGSPLFQIDRGTPGWENQMGTPNGLDLIEYGGSTYLLICSRNGVISMWDITAAASASLLWRYPAAGDLDTPHGAVLRELDGTFYLLYAHTLGGPGRGEGSVGVAALSDPAAPPQYLADLVLPPGALPFGFLRGVELTDGGELLITDAGAELVDQGPDQGGLWSASFPALAATGATGARGSQVYREFKDMTPLLDGLAMPFEGRLMPAPD